MARIGYVLQQVGWSYNDEYYYRPEGDGGTPLKIFFDKEVAQKEALKLTANKLKGYKGYGGRYYGFCPCSYGSYDEFTSDVVEELNTKLAPVLGDKFEKIDEQEPYMWTVPNDLSEEQGVKVAEIFRDTADLVFYEVVGVEVDE